MTGATEQSPVPVGQNAATSGGSTTWMDALNEEPRFNGLSAAFLRRRLIVGAP